jgi:hypothetical protein
MNAELVLASPDIILNAEILGTPESASGPERGRSQQAAAELQFMRDHWSGRKQISGPVPDYKRYEEKLD